jgi:general secretion pathway protein L
MILNVVNEYWGGLAARYRASPLPGFLSWWRGELAGLIPASLSSRMVSPRPALWLVAEPGDAGFVVWRGGDEPERSDIFGAEEDAQILRDRWLQLLNSFDDGARKFACVCPQMKC